MPCKEKGGARGKLELFAGRGRPDQEVSASRKEKKNSFASLLLASLRGS
jgi:hypothetical protein